MLSSGACVTIDEEEDEFSEADEAEFVERTVYNPVSSYIQPVYNGEPITASQDRCENQKTNTNLALNSECYGTGMTQAECRVDGYCKNLGYDRGEILSWTSCEHTPHPVAFHGLGWWTFDMEVDCLACPAGPSGGWSFCTEECPCEAEEADCDSDAECAGDLVCVHDVGANYGFSAAADVCLPDDACASSTSQIPVMTGAASPSGTVTRSGAYSGSYEAWKAFDASNSMWLSEAWEDPAWVSYQWASGTRLIDRYEISFANGSSLTSRAPRDWTFQGWNGSSWVILDTRTNQTGWSGSQTRSFDVSNPGHYSRYRLHVTEDNDNRADVVVLSVAGLSMYGCQ